MCIFVNQRLGSAITKTEKAIQLGHFWVEPRELLEVDW